MSRPRPLSPHLQVYKPQLTSVLSIFHRFTGVILCGGAIALVWWLVALEMWPSAPSYYACMQSFYSGFFGKIFLFGLSFSFFYHLCNGVRHLMWDVGCGYDLPTAYKTGWIVIFGSLGLTVLAWLCAFL